MNALRNFSPIDEIRQLPQVPCARTNLLMGMATGACVGMIQVVFGRGAYEKCLRIQGIMRSMNWAVGSFVFISIFGW